MTTSLRVVDDAGAPSTSGARAPASGARTAVILVNVGTPASPATGDVRRYLREFLSDARVLDIHPLARWALLSFVILPFRSPKSAAQYRSIWTDAGSPLLVHGRALVEKVQARLPGAEVLLAMRYGAPSLADAVAHVRDRGITRAVLVPLFPQYASASTGTAVARAFELFGALPRVPDVSVVPPFFLDDGFLDSAASIIREVTNAKPVDHLLFSYHGLPLHQVQRIHATCAGTDACCAVLGPDNASCYRAQCLATTRALVQRLGITKYSTSFQSRLGRAVWLLPNTENVLDDLARAGVKRLGVACPSFVSDCLETVEEIGVRAHERFRAAGGDELVRIPCVNAADAFADAVVGLVRRAGGLA